MSSNGKGKDGVLFLPAARNALPGCRYSNRMGDPRSRKDLLRKAGVSRFAQNDERRLWVDPARHYNAGLPMSEKAAATIRTWISQPSKQTPKARSVLA